MAHASVWSDLTLSVVGLYVLVAADGLLTPVFRRLSPGKFATPHHFRAVSRGFFVPNGRMACRFATMVVASSQKGGCPCSFRPPFAGWLWPASLCWVCVPRLLPLNCRPSRLVSSSPPTILHFRSQLHAVRPSAIWASI